MNTIEIWKDVKGYEGKYKVSNKGRVVRMAYICKNGNKHKKRLLNQTSIIKNVPYNKTGYKKVCLNNNGVTQHITVHKLVMITFNPVEHYETINHKDGNGFNNCLDNLEYMTNFENINHYLNKKGQRILRTIHKPTGIEFNSLREAAKFHLKQKGELNPSRERINHVRYNLKRHNDYEML